MDRKMGVGVGVGVIEVGIRDVKTSHLSSFLNRWP